MTSSAHHWQWTALSDSFPEGTAHWRGRSATLRQRNGRRVSVATEALLTGLPPGTTVSAPRLRRQPPTLHPVGGGYCSIVVLQGVAGLSRIASRFLWGAYGDGRRLEPACGPHCSANRLWCEPRLQEMRSPTVAGNSTDPGRSVTSKVTAILMAFADGGVHTLTEIADWQTCPRRPRTVWPPNWSPGACSSAPRSAAIGSPCHCA